jgi:hypothetical protein
MQNVSTSLTNNYVEIDTKILMWLVDRNERGAAERPPLIFLRVAPKIENWQPTDHSRRELSIAISHRSEWQIFRSAPASLFRKTTRSSARETMTKSSPSRLMDTRRFGVFSTELPTSPTDMSHLPSDKTNLSVEHIYFN